MLQQNQKILISAVIFLLVTFMAVTAFASTEAAAPAETSSSQVAWWIWPLSLFIVTFILGILAVLGGVGGGVLCIRGTNIICKYIKYRNVAWTFSACCNFHNLCIRNTSKLHPFVVIAIIEVAVLILAASGILKAGGH